MYDESVAAAHEESIRRGVGCAALLVAVRWSIGEGPHHEIRYQVTVDVSPRRGMRKHPDERLDQSGRRGDIRERDGTRTVCGVCLPASHGGENIRRVAVARCGRRHRRSLLFLSLIHI